MSRFAFGRPFSTSKTTKQPRSSIVETLAPQKVGKMVPEWSQFSILSFLLILKPLSIDSSVFEGPRDSFSSLLSCFVLTPFPDLYFCMFLVEKVTFWSPKSGLKWAPGWGTRSGDQGAFARRGPKAVQRRSREANRAAKGSQNGPK